MINLTFSLCVLLIMGVYFQLLIKLLLEYHRPEVKILTLKVICHVFSETKIASQFIQQDLFTALVKLLDTDVYFTNNSADSKLKEHLVNILIK